jgi:phosphoribosylaminoimidazole carboxylase (NCAIR synthetase)
MPLIVNVAPDPTTSKLVPFAKFIAVVIVRFVRLPVKEYELVPEIVRLGILNVVIVPPIVFETPVKV